MILAILLAAWICVGSEISSHFNIKMLISKTNHQLMYVPMPGLIQGKGILGWGKNWNACFWGYPPPPPPPPPHTHTHTHTSLLPILLSHIGSHVKRRQSQITIFKNLPKFPIFICETNFTEMNPSSINGDTEQTVFCPQTDRWSDGQGETSIPPFNFVEAGCRIMPREWRMWRAEEWINEYGWTGLLFFP